MFDRSPPGNESPILRFSNELTAPISQVFGMGTPSALFTWAVETYNEKRCLAFRKIIAHVLGTRLLGDWQYYTYAQVGQRVREMGAGLKKLLNGRSVQRLHMASANSANWFMLSHAASMVSVELICFNPLLSQRELTHTLTYVTATAIYTEITFLARLLTPLIECPHVRLIIYDTASEVQSDLEVIEREVKALKIGLQGRIRIISVEELCRTGLEVLENCELEKPTDTERIWGHIYARTLSEYEYPPPDALTNGQMAAGFAGMHHALKGSLAKDDTYLSYLPLYFRLEYDLVNAFFISGVTIGFGTELDMFLLSAPYNPKCCPASYGDIQSFNPTILFGIKPWWDLVHGKLLKVLAARPMTEQNEFWKWLEKKRDVVGGRLPPLVHVFEKWGHIAEIRSSFFGERIRWIGVMCSMMTVEKRELLGLVFGGTRGIMVEGWSLPHMNSDITFMPPQHHIRTGLGRPLPSVEIKLFAAPDENVNKGRNIYRGQIHIRGPSIARIKTPRHRTGVNAGLTLSALSPPSTEWMDTGRVGEWNVSKQSLRVIGSLTEPLTSRYLADYIPIERLEETYKKIGYVVECVLLHSWKSVPLLAILCIDEDSLRGICDRIPELGTSAMTSDLLADHRLVKAEIVKDLQKHGMRLGLVRFELVEGIVMSLETWGKGLRHMDGTVDREKVVGRYRGKVEELAVGLK